MEHAQSTLSQLLAGREDFRQKVEVLAMSELPAPWPLTRSMGSWGRGSDGTFFVDVFGRWFFLLCILLGLRVGRERSPSQARAQPGCHCGRTPDQIRLSD